MRFTGVPRTASEASRACRYYDALPSAPGETGPVFCRSERDQWSRLYTSRHDSSIFQRGDVGRADQADGGFVRFAVFGDDDRFQRLVVGEHCIDVVQ